MTSKENIPVPIDDFDLLPMDTAAASSTDPRPNFEEPTALPKRAPLKTMSLATRNTLVKQTSEITSKMARDARLQQSRDISADLPDFQVAASNLADLLRHHQPSRKRKADVPLQSPNQIPPRADHPDAQGLTHAAALDNSYNSPTRMWRSPKDGLYVAGTSRPQDWLDDARLAMSWDVRTTVKYAEVRAEVLRKRPPFMVGDSLGGAVCDQIGKEFGIPVLTYGNPMPTWMTGNRKHLRNQYDLVSVLDGYTTGVHTDADHWWNPHDYHNTARKYQDGEIVLHDEDI